MGCSVLLGWVATWATTERKPSETAPVLPKEIVAHILHAFSASKRYCSLRQAVLCRELSFASQGTKQHPWPPPQNASSTPPQAVTTKMSPDIAKCPVWRSCPDDKSYRRKGWMEICSGQQPQLSYRSQTSQWLLGRVGPGLSSLPISLQSTLAWPPGQEETRGLRVLTE